MADTRVRLTAAFQEKSKFEELLKRGKAGVTRMQVLSAPKQLQGIAAFGLEITGYVAE